MYLVRSSRPKEEGATLEAAENVRLGASPRATQALIKLAKVIALAAGRQHVTKQDIIEVSEPVMSHRLLIDFRAQAQGRDCRYVLNAIIRDTKARSIPKVSMWTREILKLGQQQKTGKRKTLKDWLKVSQLLKRKPAGSTK